MDTDACICASEFDDRRITSYSPPIGGPETDAELVSISERLSEIAVWISASGCLTCAIAAVAFMMVFRAAGLNVPDSEVLNDGALCRGAAGRDRRAYPA